MRNKRRNMMSALAATVLMSNVSVMRTMMRPETAIEMWGVRLRAWSRPRTRGRPPSRPIAKATRLDEKMREFRAARAPRATPNTMIWRPYGITRANLRDRVVVPAHASGGALQQEARRARSGDAIPGGPDRDERDEDEDQRREANHEEVGAGDVLLRVPRLLAGLRDDLVPFEHDERETHRAEEREELYARRVPAEEGLEVL